VVIQDADMEYDPADVPRLVEPIRLGVADVVFGSRLSGGQPQRAYMFWHLVGNRFLSLLTNVLFNTTLSDMETGYKVFRADVLRALDLRQTDFAIEPEITAKVCKRKLRIYELPIAYYGRPRPPRMPVPRPRSAPLLALFALAVSAAIAYQLFLAVATTPNNYDALTYHLTRAVAWLHQGHIGYFDAAAGRANGFPPNAEI